MQICSTKIMHFTTKNNIIPQKSQKNKFVLDKNTQMICKIRRKHVSMQTREKAGRTRVPNNDTLMH